MMSKDRDENLDRLYINMRMAWFNSEGETDGAVVRDMMLAGMECEGESFIIAIRIAHYLRLWIEREKVARFSGRLRDLMGKVPRKLRHPPQNSWKIALGFLVRDGCIREVGDREYVVLR